MRAKRIFLVLGILILLVGGVSEIHAQRQGGFYGNDQRGDARFSNYYSQPDFRNYYRSEGRLETYYPIFGDPQSCIAREDIILQVPPGGCQPSVVRSDLLAEQNVPVFCQVDAIKLNPLIDVKEIRNIRFRGDYPEEVVGTGFPYEHQSHHLQLST